MIQDSIKKACNVINITLNLLCVYVSNQEFLEKSYKSCFKGAIALLIAAFVVTTTLFSSLEHEDKILKRKYTLEELHSSKLSDIDCKSLKFGQADCFLGKESYHIISSITQDFGKGSTLLVRAAVYILFPLSVIFFFLAATARKNRYT